MASLQIDLAPDVERRLHEVAQQRGVSVPELVAEALENLVKLPEPPAAEEETALAEPIWDQLVELAARLPDEEFERLPEDGSEQHDHYIYGTPKRPRCR